MNFFTKMREMRLVEDNSTFKSIKQLELLFMVLGLDREIIKDAIEILMDRIVS